MKWDKLDKDHVFFFDGFHIGHQFGFGGWGKTIHRLVKVDIHGTILEEGNPDSYDQATFAKFGDNWYMAVTDFNEGAPQAETVFRLDPGVPIVKVMNKIGYTHPLEKVGE